MSDTQILTPNFMPYSKTAGDLIKHVESHIPYVTAAQLAPSTIGSTVIDVLKKLYDVVDTVADKRAVFGEIEDVSDNIILAATTNNKLDDAVIDRKLPISIALMFMTFQSSMIGKLKLPIMSTPNLEVKIGAGWEPASSLWTLVSKLAPQGLGPIATFISYLGKDIQYGPMFNTKSLMDTKPSFSVTTYLVNDSTAAAKTNSTILRRLLITALPAARAFNSTGDRWQEFKSGLQRTLDFSPSALFNIDVGIGLSSTQSLKKLFLCTADISVKPHGIYRDGRIPEAWELTINFTSLLPDYANFQLAEFDALAGDTRLLGINTAKQSTSVTPAARENKKHIDDILSTASTESAQASSPRNTVTSAKTNIAIPLTDKSSLSEQSWLIDMINDNANANNLTDQTHIDDTHQIPVQRLHIE